MITISGINGSMSFSPSALTVRSGTSVRWHNADVVAHTATQDGGAFETGLIPAGSTSGTITLAVAGTYAYHCSVHPTMTGAVTVLP